MSISDTKISNLNSVYNWNCKKSKVFENIGVIVKVVKQIFFFRNIKQQCQGAVSNTYGFQNKFNNIFETLGNIETYESAENILILNVLLKQEETGI